MNGEPKEEKIVVDFGHKVKFLDGESDTLEMRAAKGRDLLAVPATENQHEAQIRLAAHLSNKTYEELLDLDLRDVMAIEKKMNQAFL